MTDKKALKILFNTFWSSTGWRDKYVTAPADFEFAKSQGVMFDPVTLNHNQMLERAIRVCSQVSKKQVVDAFLVSLTTRRLELRSALGSFAVGRHMPQHKYKKGGPYSHQCLICGETKGDGKPDNLSVLNFERFKWGGVRHDQPLYIAFDLERLSECEIIKPTPDDLACLKRILDAADSLSDKGKPSDLVKLLAPLIRSNATERRTLIEILGLSGILQPKSHPGYLKAFVDDQDREQTPWHTDDWQYPVQWWHGVDGVNEKAVSFWFPQLKWRSKR